MDLEDSISRRSSPTRVCGIQRLEDCPGKYSIDMIHCWLLSIAYATCQINFLSEAATSVGCDNTTQLAEITQLKAWQFVQEHAAPSRVAALHLSKRALGVRLLVDGVHLQSMLCTPRPILRSCQRRLKICGDTLDKTQLVLTKSHGDLMILSLVTVGTK